MMHLRKIGARTAIVWAALVLATDVPPSRAADRQTGDIVREANRALADGDYQAALDGYCEAEAAEPDSTELNYNRGLAHYVEHTLPEVADADTLIITEGEVQPGQLRLLGGVGDG